MQENQTLSNARYLVNDTFEQRLYTCKDVQNYSKNTNKIYTNLHTSTFPILLNMKWCYVSY